MQPDGYPFFHLNQSALVFFYEHSIGACRYLYISPQHRYLFTGFFFIGFYIETTTRGFYMNTIQNNQKWHGCIGIHFKPAFTGNLYHSFVANERTRVFKRSHAAQPHPAAIGQIELYVSTVWDW